ncbi:MAG: CoA transferase [Actinomycetota bacterium]|nr:CoA transferase [Actinomycetota bacterium]
MDLSALRSSRFCARLAALAGDEVSRFAPPAGVTEGPEDVTSLDLSDAYLSDVVATTEIDFSDTAARTQVEAAIVDADVVISSYAAGTYHSPYDGPTLDALNPGAVQVVTSPFGLTGPYRDLPTSSLTDWAAGGYLYITGAPDRPPLAGPANVCAYATGYMAAIAMEAGLALVRAGGRAERFDVSHMETMLSLHQLSFPRLAAGHVMTRTGHDVGPATYPHGPYQARDGEVFVGIVTDEEWDRFLIAIGRSELSGNPRLETGPARKANSDQVDEIVTAWMASLPMQAAADILQAMRVPATPCTTPGDLLIDPQLEYRGYFREAKTARSHTSVQVPGNPIHSEPARGDVGIPSGESGRSPSVSGEVALPLLGVTVVDMSLWWAGPMAARILGDLGANVIRLERPTPPRDLATWPLSQRFVHAGVNRNKRSAVIDINTPEGALLSEQLITRADVFIQNFRPGVVDRMGIGPERMLGINPRLVYASLSGYGTQGPKSQWGTYGTLSEAASSVRGLTHYPGERGMRLGDQLPDAVCGLAGTVAVMRGLRQREATGGGCSIDISQLETYVALIGEEIAAASLRTRPDWQAPGGAADDIVVPCAGHDAWVAVTLPGPDRASGVADLVREEAGINADVSLREAVATYAASRSKSETAAFLQSLGVAAFPVLDARDLVEDPHLAARRSLIEVTVDGVTGRFPASPIRAEGRSLAAIRRPAPMEGEHTREIMSDELFLDPEEIDRLLASGAIRQRVESR